MPKIFIPTPSRWQIVVPYRPIGVALIVVLTGLCTYLVFRSDILLVRKIEVENIGGEGGIGGFVNMEEVQDAVSQHLTKSIVFLDTKEITENLKKQFLPIAEVSIEKHLPDKLVVQIEGREPVAVLVIPEEKGIKDVNGINEKFLVDENGFVFAKCPRGLILPELQMYPVEVEPSGGSTSVNLGDTVSGDLVTAALDIINGFGQIEDLDAVAVYIKNQNEIQVDTNKDFFVIFTTEKKINEQTLALKQIYENAEHQGKALKRVDLRFRLPVVEYE